MDQLHVISDYNDPTLVMLGNGVIILITHYGYTFLTTDSQSLSLKQLLYAPQPEKKNFS